MLRILKIFRDADWLTSKRAAIACLALLVIEIAIAFAWIASSNDGVDFAGKPLGTDFISFWTASKLALGGRPAAVYDFAAHRAQQLALFPHLIGYAAFFYPPIFLLICLPLAVLPYLLSLAVWLGLTGLAYWRVLRAWLGDQVAALPLLAFPAVFLNLIHGQNGLLSAALLGGGALMLDSRPLVAGLCLCALVYKPHLAIVIPFALIAARRWRSLGAFAVTAAGFGLLSLALFGAATWTAFFGSTSVAQTALERNWVGNDKMQSVFGAVRLLHGGLVAAYGLQTVAALAVFCGLFFLHRRSFRSSAEGPAIAAAALLVTPFLLDYDLILLAVPLAWILREGHRTGFLSWEKIVCLVGFVLPVISLPVARLAYAPLGPIICTAMFVLVLRRAVRTSAVVARSEATKQSRDLGGSWIASLRSQ
jgi:alpha-1,2-mannosyltransferase